MTVAAGGPTALFGHDPASYARHALHAGGRAYDETNCYTDVIVELLHARGDEPLAALGCAVRVDFEGDQWTFLKPPPEELEGLFGVDVHEMQPYRPLPEQIAQQLAAGRTLLVEVDSFHLPDTAATSYGREHVKTSIAAEAIDPAAERLRYFHGPGLFELSGDDYRGVFRQGRDYPGEVLPPYTELVRFDAGPRLAGAECKDAARALLGGHLRRRPATNPFARFGERLALDLPALLAGDHDDYHSYAFATVRMAGSAFEVAAAQATWLFGETPAAEPLARIIDGCKVLSFRLARRRPFDPEPVVAELVAAWDEATARLDDLTG
ncbi:MAG: DUF1839 family protein [Solirubrobacteraceae bacterium]